MSSWSRRVKICGLKSSIEVQLPMVSGNLKKMLYSCLCTSFVSCSCVLTEKIDETGRVVTIDHFSRLWVRSLLVSYGDLNVWPDALLQATVHQSYSSFISQCPRTGKFCGVWERVNDIWRLVLLWDKNIHQTSNRGFMQCVITSFNHFKFKPSTKRSKAKHVQYIEHMWVTTHATEWAGPDLTTVLSPQWDFLYW